MGKSGTDRAVRPGSIAAIRLSVGAAYPLPDCRRTISRYRLQQTCRIILDDQHLAVNRLQKALSDDMIEEGEQPVVKAKARSEEHTSELKSLMRTSYAVFCLKKKITSTHKHTTCYNINNMNYTHNNNTE